MKHNKARTIPAGIYLGFGPEDAIHLCTDNHNDFFTISGDAYTAFCSLQELNAETAQTVERTKNMILCLFDLSVAYRATIYKPVTLLEAEQVTNPPRTMVSEFELASKVDGAFTAAFNYLFSPETNAWIRSERRKTAEYKFLRQQFLDADEAYYTFLEEKNK